MLGGKYQIDIHRKYFFRKGIAGSDPESPVEFVLAQMPGIMGTIMGAASLFAVK